MLITPDQPRLADHALRAGQLTCPQECGGRLRPWGWAIRRPVRGGDRVRLVRPRRARCATCGRTHVLLPASMLPGRGYAMSVIGPVLTMAASGHSHRRIATQLGIPADTVRGWVRRLRVRADMLRHYATAVLYQLDSSVSRLDPPGATSSTVHTAVHIVGMAAAAFARQTRGLTDPWQAACAVTSGLLLANTDRPFPPLR